MFSVCYYTFPGSGSDNGYSSACGLKPSLHTLPYRADMVAPIVFLIIFRYGPRRNTSFPTVPLWAGTCLPSHCSETALVYPSISRSPHSNSCTCYIVPSLKLFILNGLQSYRHFFFSKSCACDDSAWSHLPSCGLVCMWCLLPNCCHCTVLKASHPEQFPHRVLVGQGVLSSTIFST
jgi:hypothetical protein